MTISAVQTQGRGDWYSWVTGYYLYHSMDGQRWTGYTQSGDALHSNVCLQMLLVTETGLLITLTLFSLLHRWSNFIVEPVFSAVNTALSQTK